MGKKGQRPERSQPPEQHEQVIDWGEVVSQPASRLDQRAALGFQQAPQPVVPQVRDIAVSERAMKEIEERRRQNSYRAAQAAQHAAQAAQQARAQQRDMFGNPMYSPRQGHPLRNPTGNPMGPAALPPAVETPSTGHRRRNAYIALGTVAGVLLVGGGGAGYFLGFPDLSGKSSATSKQASKTESSYPTMSTDTLVCGGGIKPLPVASTILRDPNGRIEIGFDVLDKETNTKVRAFTPVGLRTIAKASVSVCGMTKNNEPQTLAEYTNGSYVIHREAIIMQNAAMESPPNKQSPNRKECERMTAIETTPKLIVCDPARVGNDRKTHVVFLGEDNITQSPRYEKIVNEDARITRLTTPGVNNANAGTNKNYIKLFSAKMIAEFLKTLDDPAKCATLQGAIDESMTTFVQSYLQNQGVKTPLPTVSFSGSYSGLLKAYESNADNKKLLTNPGLNVVLNPTCVSGEAAIKPAKGAK
ncbi:MAG TPA: hypothetical protein VF575_00965 [Candidatus Saccharimonadales bacterium]